MLSEINDVPPYLLSLGFGLGYPTAQRTKEQKPGKKNYSKKQKNPSPQPLVVFVCVCVSPCLSLLCCVFVRNLYETEDSHADV